MPLNGVARLGWLAGVVVVGVLATVALLALSGALNGLWSTFPGILGWRGWLIVGVSSLAMVAGLALALRLPLRWAFVIGAAVLIGLRVAAMLLIDPPLARDPSGYDGLARDVLAGECCFDYRPMGFPILLAAAYAVGLSGKVVGLAFALAGGALVWALGRRLAGERAAVVALYLYAITPSLTLLTGVLLTEPLYATLLLAALIALPDATAQRRGALRVALAGVVLGLAQYVRATAIFLAPALVLPLVLRRAWRQVALFVLVVLVALVPVLAATGGPFTSPLGGWTLLVGTNQEHDGEYNDEDVSLYESWGDERERIAREEALRRIASDPLGFAALAVRKVHVLWATEGYAVFFAFGGTTVGQDVREGLRLIAQLYYVPLLVAATLALWRMRRAPPEPALAMLAIIVTVVLMHVFVEVQGRYHAYLLPLLAVLAATLVAAPPPPDESPLASR